jgi:hypothetical protein
MDLQYRLKEGNYLLYDLSTPATKLTGEHRLRLKTGTVAIAFDRSTGTLYEHGNPSRIQSWASNARRHLRAAGAWDRAEDIVVVSGALPVDEINKCLAIKGYCSNMLGQPSTCLMAN